MCPWGLVKNLMTQDFEKSFGNKDVSETIRKMAPGPSSKRPSQARRKELGPLITSRNILLSVILKRSIRAG